MFSHPLSASFLILIFVSVPNFTRTTLPVPAICAIHSRYHTILHTARHILRQNIGLWILYWRHFLYLNSLEIPHSWPLQVSYGSSLVRPLRILTPSQYKDGLPRYGIPYVNTRRSWDSLIFTMGIPTLVRLCFYIETGPDRKTSRVEYIMVLWCATENQELLWYHLCRRW